MAKRPAQMPGQEHNRLTGDDPIIKAMRVRARAFRIGGQGIFLVCIALMAWAIWTGASMIAAEATSITPEDLGGFFGRIAHGYNQAKGG